MRLTGQPWIGLLKTAHRFVSCFLSRPLVASPWLGQSQTVVGSCWTGFPLQILLGDCVVVCIPCVSPGRNTCMPLHKLFHHALLASFALMSCLIYFLSIHYWLLQSSIVICFRCFEQQQLNCEVLVSAWVDAWCFGFLLCLAGLMLAFFPSFLFIAEKFFKQHPWFVVISRMLAPHATLSGMSKIQKDALLWITQLVCLVNSQ